MRTKSESRSGTWNCDESVCNVNSTRSFLAFFATTLTALRAKHAPCASSVPSLDALTTCMLFDSNTVSTLSKSWGRLIESGCLTRRGFPHGRKFQIPRRAFIGLDIPSFHVFTNSTSSGVNANVGAEYSALSAAWSAFFIPRTCSKKSPISPSSSYCFFTKSSFDENVTPKFTVHPVERVRSRAKSSSPVCESCL